MFGGGKWQRISHMNKIVDTHSVHSLGARHHLCKLI